ncbi:SOS response-associated peptidase [Paenibacillus sp. IB182496]|uniref:Abasic site processing protein n=1 Tax=Paenibacillus sabuli TaxID=2772509 RepID=A0A927BVB3_9BACL|nr:SOS response-associated peptidase [Paenibacillus sabuli]MBD2846144.1 SOS response-associated peptidase [Paenibacillus sabuli]
MCGRFTLVISLEELIRYYDIDSSALDALAPRYNIAPTQQVPALIDDGRGRRLGTLRWGLVPVWANDERIGSRMINARSETAAAKSAFREALARRRCLIPADGFYEWQKTDAGKQPMRIVRKGGGLLGLAGLYEVWRAPDGRKVPTCTILTTAANNLMAPIHDRMPVVIPEPQTARWLDRTLRDPAELTALMQPLPSEELEAYPVDRAVGNVANDEPRLIEPRGPKR